MHSQIESKVLRKRKFTIDTFRDEGKKKCTTAVYNDLCAKVDKVEISLQFLLFGFDSSGIGHIFVVDGKEDPQCYDDLGVWAVGSGAAAALSAIAFHIDKQQFNTVTSTGEEAAYFACEAKFMAESSGYVGRDSAVLFMYRSNAAASSPLQFLDREEINTIKKRWLEEGAPKVPEGIKDEILTLFNPLFRIVPSVPKTPDPEVKKPE